MKRIILPLMALLTFSIISCEDETEAVVKPGIAQFETSDLSFSENSEKTTVIVSFNKQASDAGDVVVKVGSPSMDKFQFYPGLVDETIRLPFSKGQSQVSFEITALNNDILDGDKTVSFTILSISQGYEIGANKTLAMKCVDDESPARADFVASEGDLLEDGGSGAPVTIMFSHETKAPGMLRLSIQSDDAIYGTHFITDPPAVGGIITLPVQEKKSWVSFIVSPVNDALYDAGRTINYSIVEAEGGVQKGGVLEHNLKIIDDELEGTGKGYEIIAGNWRYKKRYEYNEDGTISKVYWDQQTPGHSGGVYSYVYNSAAQLEKIIQSSVREEVFLRENGRIVRSEEHTNNVLTKYTLYGYDDAGNVAEAAVHYRQPDGSLKLALIFVYLYHLDHNVYKVLGYSVSDGSDEPVLISTKTFDHYYDVENPFPMVDILPDQKAQNKLPASYRVEENGHDIVYGFTYQYSDEGRPLTRTATSSSGGEVAYYEYY
ncbi:MAG TPA: hypothetical protein VF141_05090 [Chryseolinea sp.]